MALKKIKNNNKAVKEQVTENKQKNISPVLFGFTVGALVVLALNALVIGFVIGKKLCKDKDKCCDNTVIK